MNVFRWFNFHFKNSVSFVEMLCSERVGWEERIKSSGELILINLMFSKALAFLRFFGIDKFFFISFDLKWSRN